VMPTSRGVFWTLFQESQNDQSWKGPLWVTQSNPLPKQGHPEQAAQHRGQTGPEHVQRRRLHNPSGQPVPGLHHPQSKKVLPHVLMDLLILQFVPAAPCPDAGHCWKEFGPISRRCFSRPLGLSELTGNSKRSMGWVWRPVHTESQFQQDSLERKRTGSRDGGHGKAFSANTSCSM